MSSKKAQNISQKKTGLNLCCVEKKSSLRDGKIKSISNEAQSVSESSEQWFYWEEHLMRNPDALVLAPGWVKSSNSLMYQVLLRSGLQLEHLTREQKKDPKLVYAAVSNNVGALRFANKALRSDEAFMKKCCQLNPKSYAYASSAFRANESYTLSVVRKDGSLLCYAHPMLRNKRDVIYAAVKSSGLALSYVDPKWLSERALVRLALFTWAGAWSLIDNRLKTDRRLVRLALEKNAYVYTVLSAQQQEDKYFCAYALAKDINVHVYVPETIWRWASLKPKDAHAPLQLLAQLQAWIQGQKECRALRAVVGQKKPKAQGILQNAL